jgi:hypothetical protein
MKHNMAHFAHITDGIVDQVIVIDEATLATGHWGDPSEWVQTSYNTIAGKYEKGTTEQEKTSLKLAGTTKDIKARNRKNYAGIGYKYDVALDTFVPPSPFASWVLDKETCNWNAPKKYPTDGKKYSWDEALLDWVIVE